MGRHLGDDSNFETKASSLELIRRHGLKIYDEPARFQQLSSRFSSGQQWHEDDYRLWWKHWTETLIQAFVVKGNFAPYTATSLFGYSKSSYTPDPTPNLNEEDKNEIINHF